MTENRIDVWVSSGSHEKPFYRFYADSLGSIHISSFNKNSKNIYTFRRLDSSISHPFYVSDTGYKSEHSSLINLSGDGSELMGIKGDEAFAISFKSSDAADLYYFCTSHSGMFAEFSLIEPASARIDSDPGYLYSYKADANTWSENVRVNRQINGTTSRGILQAAQVEKSEYDSGFVGSIITGTLGDDVIRGLAGFDRLTGKAGDDLIHGGNGRDIIN